MWIGGARGEFWMCLSGYHIRMILELDHFGEHTIWRCCRHDEASLLHLFSVCRVELESVSVSFRHNQGIVILRNEGSMLCFLSLWILLGLRMTETLIDTLCESTRADDTWILSEAHIASLGREFLLVVHDVDDIVLSLWSELFTRCICDTEDIASEFYSHNL